MTRDQVQGLAKATCCWLAYKQITGFKETLGESMLAIPISEYLTRSIIIESEGRSVRTTSWKLESEVLYKNLKLAPENPELSCDFAGIPSSARDIRFILETKYLKSSAVGAVARITADLIRLSLNLKVNLKRYFLLAGEAKFFKPRGDTVLARSLELNEGQGFFFDPFNELRNPNFLNKFTQYEKLIQGEYLSGQAFIYCTGKHAVSVGSRAKPDQTMQVMIWSVGGSPRPAKTAFQGSTTVQ